MTDDFETFTRDKIARLRAEADALEKILKEFVGAKARAASPRRGAEASGFGAVLDAIAGAGSEGLTLDEMIEAAEAQGYMVKRNTLRSQIWQAKQDGRVEQLGAGRYRTPMVEEPLPESSQTGSSLPPVRTRDRPSFSSTPPREEFIADLDDEIPF